MVRRVLPLICLAAVVATAPAAAVAAPPGAHAAKKKKKKKPAPLTATVSGTFSIRQDLPGGFGNDNGPNWQELTVSIKKAVVTFPKGIMGSSAKAKVTFTYHAEASTQDRSWQAGCDSEQRRTDGTWTGEAYVGIKETSWLQTDGKSKKYAGWTVSVQAPDDIPLTSKGSHNEWESILMQNCLTIEDNTPLGGWGVGFARPEGVGKLAADNRSVPLLSTNTDVGQTGSANGKVTFNKAPR